MFRGPSEPVKTPDYYSIELTLAGVPHEFIEFRSGVFSARVAHINIFADEVETSCGAVGSEVSELKFTTLVFGAHTGIYSDSHGSVLRRGERKRLLCYISC